MNRILSTKKLSKALKKKFSDAKIELVEKNFIQTKSISFETEDGIFEGRIKVLVYDTEHLEQLMHKFEQVEGVQRVTRWDSDEELLN
jgi:translation elongation factor EF-1beta